MDLNFTYSNNASPNFAGIFSKAYERVSERRQAKVENDKQAQRTKTEAEAIQKSTTNTVQTVESWGVDSKKPKPLREDWQMVGQPRQFNRAPRVLRPGQPSQSVYEPEQPKSPTPKSIRPGVSEGAVYPAPPKKPRAPRAPRRAQGSTQP